MSNVGLCSKCNKNVDDDNAKGINVKVKNEKGDISIMDGFACFDCGRIISLYEYNEKLGVIIWPVYYFDKIVSNNSKDSNLEIIEIVGD